MTDTKTRLLEIARDHYLQVGAEQFSLREVARRARLTAPAIYRYYANKEVLLAAVCAQGFRVFADYLLSALGRGTPLDRLLASGSQYLRFALEHPHDYHVIFMRGDVVPPSGALDAPPEPTFQFLVDRVRECQDAGVVRKGDPTEFAVTVWAHVHGLVSLRIAGHLQPAGDDAAFTLMFDRSLLLLLDGLSPRD